MPQVSLSYEQVAEAVDQLTAEEKKRLMSILNQNFKKEFIAILNSISDDWKARGVTQGDIDEAITEVRREEQCSVR